MIEIARITTKDGKNESKVTYYFDTQELYNHTCNSVCKMTLKEYNKVKAKTIEKAKDKKWMLTFETVK